MKDGITYFGYLENDNNNDNMVNDKKEENDLDFLLPIKKCDNLGRFFKIQYIKKFNEYILNDLKKGFGTFVKIQDSIYLRNKCLINIGSVYLAIIFCEKTSSDKLNRVG